MLFAQVNLFVFFSLSSISRTFAEFELLRMVVLLLNIAFNLTTFFSLQQYRMTSFLVPTVMHRRGFLEKVLLMQHKPLEGPLNLP
jgi:hypothetical protein